MLRPTIVLGLLLGTGALTSGAEVLRAPCNSEQLRERQQLKLELRQSQPGDRPYVPHPFPTDDSTITRNLVYEVNRLWRGARGLDDQTLYLLEVVEKGDAEFEATRVENWRGNVCASPLLGDHLYLVIIREPKTKRELARASMGQTGLLEKLRFSPDNEIETEPVLSAELRLAKLRSRGVGAESPTLISSIGTLRCSIFRPCLAARTYTGTLIVTPDGEEFIVADSAARYGRADIQAALASSTDDRRIVSIGHDTYAIAIRRGN